MDFILALASSFWIGVLTSISPCPLTTNIAALSFISKDVSSKKILLLTGILYTLGRVLSYVLLSFVIIKSLTSIPALSIFLQTKIIKFIGPLLLVIGLVLLELIKVPLPKSNNNQGLSKFFSSLGIWGAFPLGALFALSFCPVSAALFFGSLIPIASQFESTTIIPMSYGLGTGLPVLIFSIVFIFAINKLSVFFKTISKIELLVRKLMGTILVLLGLYFTSIYNLNLF